MFDGIKNSKPKYLLPFLSLVIIGLLFLYPFIRTFNKIATSYDYNRTLFEWANLRQSLTVFREIPLRNIYLNGGEVFPSDISDPLSNPVPVILTFFFNEIVSVKTYFLILYFVFIFGSYLLFRQFVDSSFFIPVIISLTMGFSGFVVNRMPDIKGWGYLLFPLLLYLSTRKIKNKAFFFLFTALLYLLLSHGVLVFIAILFNLFLFVFLIDSGNEKAGDVKFIISGLVFCLLFHLPKLFILGRVLKYEMAETGYYLFPDKGMKDIIEFFRYFINSKFFRLSQGQDIYYKGYQEYIGYVPLLYFALAAVLVFKKTWKLLLILLLNIFLVFSHYNFSPVYGFLKALDLAQVPRFYNYFVFFIVFYTGFAIIGVFQRIDLIEHRSIKKVLFHISLALLVINALFLFRNNQRVIDNIFQNDFRPALEPGEYYSVKYAGIAKPQAIPVQFLMYQNIKSNAGTITDFFVKKTNSIEPRVTINLKAELTENKNYPGEASFLLKENSVKTIRISPNNIIVKAEVRAPDYLVINQNYSAWWKFGDKKIRNFNGKIGVFVEKEGELLIWLKHKPLTLYLKFIGAFIFFALFWFYDRVYVYIKNRINLKMLLISLGIFILASLLYSKTIKNGFIWDDDLVIEEDEKIKDISNIFSFFGTNYWIRSYKGAKGQYRPLRAVSLCIDYFLWGNDPSGYHLTNIFLNAISCVIIFLFLRYTLKNTIFALLVAVLFCSHPVHVESVAYIKNRTDIFAFIFALASFCFFIKADNVKNTGLKVINLLFCYVLFFLSVSSKETALTFPLIFLLYYFLFIDKDIKKLVRFFPYFVIVLIYLGIVYYINLNVPRISKDAFEIGPNIIENLPYGFATIVEYIKVLLFPMNLSVEKSLEKHSIISVRNLINLGIILYLMYLGIKSDKYILFGIFFFFIAILPVSNFVLLLGRPLSEQRIYIASFGFCFILAKILQDLFCNEKLKKVYWAGLIMLILGAYIYKLLSYSSLWSDHIRFWSKAAEVNPLSARAHINYGSVLFETGEYQEAVREYSRSLELEMKTKNQRSQKAYDIYFNLAAAHLNLGNKEKAVTYFSQANESNTLFDMKAKNVLGYIYVKEHKDIKKGLRYYKNAEIVAPENVEIKNNIGSAYQLLKMYASAVDKFKEAINLNPDFAGSYFHLANTYRLMGRVENAKIEYERVLKIFPDFAEAKKNLEQLNKEMEKKTKK